MPRCWGFPPVTAEVELASAICLSTCKYHGIKRLAPRISFYGQLSGLARSEIVARRDGILSQVGLAGRDRESVKQFSKGMLQRLGLAQALLHQPELLILDEPTDGLDPVGRSQVRTILQRLRDEGRTVFLNSHLLQEVELICDRVAILDKGALRFVGTIEELTPSEQGIVQVHFHGAVDDIRQVFPHWEPAKDWKSGTTPHEMTLTMESQKDLDALVDRLRTANVSIRKLTWQGQTLEDAFLRLVHGQNA